MTLAVQQGSAYSEAADCLVASVIWLMSDIINLNKARKERARQRKEDSASRNRAKFRRTKGEVAREAHRQSVDTAKLDGHARGATPPAVEMMPTCSAYAPCQQLDDHDEAAFCGDWLPEAPPCLPRGPDGDNAPGGDDPSVVDAGETDASDKGAGS